MTMPIISADSHITEPPNCYTDYVDPAWRERAPRLERRGDDGDVFVIDGMKQAVMWANDFPHSDSTWPWSQELLAEHQTDLRPEQRERISCGNAADLFKIDLTALVR